MDIEGNVIYVGDVVYACHAVRSGSKYKRLLRCVVLSISESRLMCKLMVLENEKKINKTTACCVKPLR